MFDQSSVNLMLYSVQQKMLDRAGIPALEQFDHHTLYDEEVMLKAIDLVFSFETSFRSWSLQEDWDSWEMLTSRVLWEYESMCRAAVEKKRREEMYAKQEKSWWQFWK